MSLGVLSEMNYVGEEGFVLAHGFKGCSPLLFVVSGLVYVRHKTIVQESTVCFTSWQTGGGSRRGEGKGLEP